MLTASAQNTVIPKANNKTRVSTPTSSNRGSESTEPALRAALVASAANHTPALPATALSSSDSLSVSASIPPRPEPSAPRTASSNCMRSARTRKRPATFVAGHQEHEHHAAEHEPEQL